MPDESVADRKNPAALAQHKGGLRIGLAEGGKLLIECGQPCVCGSDVSLRKGLERRVELRDQAELRRDEAKVDDIGPDR